MIIGHVETWLECSSDAVGTTWTVHLARASISGTELVGRRIDRALLGTIDERRGRFQAYAATWDRRSFPALLVELGEPFGTREAALREVARATTIGGDDYGV